MGTLQSPLIQDGGTSAPFVRLVKIDIRTGAVREYAYELTNIGTVVDAGHPQGGENPNRWFVFAVDEADLPTYQPQPLETTTSCTEDHRSWDEWFRGHGPE